jgi:DNA-binding HxlR family transcriptional regulator
MSITSPGVDISGVPDAGPLDSALRRVGDRWTLLVVAALLDGPRRFGELQEAVAGVATNVLSSRLRELERQGLVASRPYSERPVRLEYELSAGAAELEGALRLLAAWGSRVGDAPLPVHGACGAPLEVHWWCPTCQQIADGDEEVWA